jgi:hypothetical protein
MTKRKNAKPAPQPEVTEAEAAAVETVTVGTDTTEAEAPSAEAPGIEPEAQPLSYLAQLNASVSERIKGKVAAQQVIRQRLAMADDFYHDGTKARAEADAIAAEGAQMLYDGRISGAFSPDEVSALLVDIFGAVPKADGTPGKTPAGDGGAIRKRIVRLVAATEYATNGDGGAYFNGLPEGEVADVVSAFAGGHKSIWAAYDAIGEIKKAHTQRTEAAFSVKAIVAITGAIASESGVRAILDNELLAVAYARLADAIAMADAEATLRRNAETREGDGE